MWQNDVTLHVGNYILLQWFCTFKFILFVLFLLSITSNTMCVYRSQDNLYTLYELAPLSIAIAVTTCGGATPGLYHLGKGRSFAPLCKYTLGCNVYSWWVLWCVGMWGTVSERSTAQAGQMAQQGTLKTQYCKPAVIWPAALKRLWPTGSSPVLSRLPLRHWLTQSRMWIA